MTVPIKAFKPFSEINCVLDLFRFPLSEVKDPKQAIIHTTNEFKEMYGIEFSQNATHGHITTDMEGETISFQELWGEGYNVDDDDLHLFHYTDNSKSTGIHDGLAHALLNPPYGLRHNNPHKAFGGKYSEFEKNWMKNLIHKFCFEVLELDKLEDGNSLLIKKWPTNWSIYFDAGDEWWGSFCWTIVNSEKQWITVITASTTD